MTFARPINDTTPRVTSQYSLSHKGTDYGYIAGTPVYASADGFISMAVNKYTTNWKQGGAGDPSKAFDTADYGNTLKINHGEGYETLYAHLKFNSILVKVGEFVKKGQKIAEVGNTGNSTGNHLHWEVRKDSKSIDPWDVLDKGFKDYHAKKDEPTPSDPLKDTIIDFDDAEGKRHTVGWYTREWQVEKKRANELEEQLKEAKKNYDRELGQVREQSTNEIKKLNEAVRNLQKDRAALLDPKVKEALEVLVSYFGDK